MKKLAAYSREDQKSRLYCYLLLLLIKTHLKSSYIMPFRDVNKETSNNPRKHQWQLMLSLSTRFRFKLCPSYLNLLAFWQKWFLFWNTIFEFRPWQLPCTVITVQKKCYQHVELRKFCLISYRKILIWRKKYIYIIRGHSVISSNTVRAASRWAWMLVTNFIRSWNPKLTWILVSVRMLEVKFEVFSTTHKIVMMSMATPSNKI